MNERPTAIIALIFDDGAVHSVRTAVHCASRNSTSAAAAPTREGNQPQPRMVQCETRFESHRIEPTVARTPRELTPRVVLLRIEAQSLAAACVYLG